jgi:hypothetical protein
VFNSIMKQVAALAQRRQVEVAVVMRPVRSDLGKDETGVANAAAKTACFIADYVTGLVAMPRVTLQCDEFEKVSVIRAASR